MNLIGINGFKTSGKDTTFKIVKNLYGDGSEVQRIAFADKLKIMAAKALGFDRPDAELIALMDECKDDWIINVCRAGESVTDSPIGARVDVVWHYLTGREYLQNFGLKAREVFGDTFWIDQILPSKATSYPAFSAAVEVAEMYPDAELVCVTDVRFPNEAERIRYLGGKVWEVLRPGLESDGHITEVPLPPDLIDWQIINDGDFDTLEMRVDEALTETV